MDQPVSRGAGAPAVDVVVLLAPNPGPMTLEGTNTYVIRDGDQVWVVDPGPRDPEHLAEILLVCGVDSRPMGVVLTHSHEDHSAGAATLARQLSARTGAQVAVHAAIPEKVPGSRPLPAQLTSDHGTVAHIIHLPGHTDDSIGLLVDGGRLLTGDTILNGSSTVIVGEDGGDLASYLQSLAILRAMGQDGRIGSLHPGHGPVIDSPLGALEAIGDAITHRQERIDQVRRARTAGILTLDRLMRTVYGPDLPEELHRGARWNLRATLEYLSTHR